MSTAYRPGENFTQALNNHSNDLSVRSSVKAMVERQNAKNERDHRRVSEWELRRAIELAHPGISPERVSAILQKQLLPKRDRKVEPAPRAGSYQTARDLVRETRKATVRSRKGARR